MKLIVESATFGEALRRASTAMSKVSIPVLSCVHLSAADGVLTIRATDMEQAMRIEIDANVIEPGTICVSAERLKNFSPPDSSQIAMGIAGTQVKIKAGTRQMTLPILDPKDWPAIDDPNIETAIETDAIGLANILDMTEFAIDEMRGSAFGGVCLRPHDGKLTAAATDGKTLSEFASEIACPDFPWIVIPRAFLPALRAALDGPIILGIGEGRLTIISARTSFTCRLLDTKFVDYSRILRPVSPVTFGVSADALSDELGRAISFAGDKASTVYISVGETIKMHAGLTERFDAELTIATPLAGAERMNFAVNGRMLKEMCDVADDCEITIGMVDAQSPVTIVSPDIGGLTMLLALCASNESQFAEVAA